MVADTLTEVNQLNNYATQHAEGCFDLWKIKGQSPSGIRNITKM